MTILRKEWYSGAWGNAWLYMFRKSYRNSI